MIQPPTPGRWLELQTDDRELCPGARPTLIHHRVPDPDTSLTGDPRPGLGTEMPSAISAVETFSWWGSGSGGGMVYPVVLTKCSAVLGMKLGSATG